MIYLVSWYVLCTIIFIVFFEDLYPENFNDLLWLIGAFSFLPILLIVEAFYVSK